MNALRSALALALLLGMAAAPLTARADYSTHPKALELLDKLRKDYAFTDAELGKVTEALAQAERVPSLIEAEQKAKEKTLTWDAYRPLHVMDGNLRNGAKFMADNKEWLARAETQYGVPGAVIAAIMGVETKYGTQTGKNRTLDALSTMGFEHPTRSAFFFGELVEFFALCRDNGFTPAAIKGSYAGALGAAQFMPSNYRKLSVDFDGDGVRNLWTVPDAIGSIANYLVSYSPTRAWQRGQPAIVPADLDHVPGDDWPLNPKMVTHRLVDFLGAGVRPRSALPGETPVGLLALQLSGEPPSKEYWLGLQNFYSVMSYNPRVFYAMAVTQLAQALQQQGAAPADAQTSASR